MKKFWYLLLIMFCGTAIVLIGFPSAYAQESRAEFTLDEIVVTAERRETSAQDTPVAVSAWDESVLDEQIMTSQQDLQMRMPSTYVAGGDVTIRGVGRTSGTYLGTDPGVGIFKDGFYNAEGVDYLTDMYDVERIENVRGPQSTLYGRSTIGGAINIITKKPTKEFSGQVKTTIGNYEKRDFHAAFGGPTGLIDNLYYRIRLSDIYDTGYKKNIIYDEYVGGKDRWYVDMKLLYEPMENLSFLATYSVMDWKDETAASSLRDEYPMKGVDWPFPGQQDARLNFGGSKYNNPFYFWLTDGPARYPGLPVHNPTVGDPYKIAQDRIGLTSQDKKEATLTASYDVGNLTLMYLTDYRDIDYELRNGDSDDGPMPADYGSKSTRFATSHYEWSGELQAIYGGEDIPFSFIGGLYYFEQHRQTFNYTQYYGELFETQWNTTTETQVLDSEGNPVPNPILAADHSVHILGGKLWDVSQSAYGQLDYTFLDKWTVSLGLRYAEDRKKGKEYSYYQYTPTFVILSAPEDEMYTWTPWLFDGVDDPAVASPPAYSSLLPAPPYQGTWSELLYKIGLDYKPNDGGLIYAKFEHGYKPGGFALASGSKKNFDAEEVDDYELGWKQLWMSDRLSTIISGYWYDYTGLQMSFYDDQVNAAYITNATSADIHGIEAEASGYVVENLLASISYSWLSTEFGDYPNQVDASHQNNPRPPNPGAVYDANRDSYTQNLKGNEMPYAPEHKFTVNLTYTIPTDIGDFSIHGLYFWQDEVFTDSFNTADNVAPDYDRIDGEIMWNSPAYTWRVILWAKNLADATDIIGQNTNDAPAGYPIIATYIPPITFGIDISYKW